MSERKTFPTSTHWGNFLVESNGKEVLRVHNYQVDENPSPIGQSLLNMMDPKTRIARPAIRKSYLEGGGKSEGALRGCEPFIEVDWDTALDLSASALKDVKSRYGNEAIYGGSYGWASAGRFHHAQSQVHRFLNCLGGYVSSRDTYSVSAGARILPRITGMTSNQLMTQAPPTEEMEDHTELLVCFGGIALKNTEVNHGGIGNHYAKSRLRKLKQKNIEIINISPIKDDMGAEMDADWWPIVPGTDVALMLGIAHTLHTENLMDAEFLQSHCVGYEAFSEYLLGKEDGIEKSADWAEAIASIPASKIRKLAHKMATNRTVITASLSLQRAEHGEQPWWMAVVLSAMSGDIGLPGGGAVFGYGSIHSYGFYGRRPVNFKAGSFPQGQNPVSSFIPVSRIADMLLESGEVIDYDGQKIKFPDIKLIYWAGGNPFHHHQDINRLRQAWAKPETVIVNDMFWTAAARHADIVFPIASTLERNDFAISSIDTWITPMHKAVKPFGQSRTDYDVFAGLAARLGIGEAFTESRSEMQWVEALYNTTRQNAAVVGVGLPDFERFWTGPQINLADQLPRTDFQLEKFRKNPAKSPLQTPSGKIEIFSSTIAGFGYDDCRGHPTWFDKSEGLNSKRARTYPFHVISNQPKGKLHSQLDHGVASKNLKTNNRTTIVINTADANKLRLEPGDIVKVFNDRGACLAGVSPSEHIRPGVVELPTGSWYDPQIPSEDKSLCVHGNPNIFTPDRGTSKLGQGPSAHSCLVDIVKFEGELPPVTVFDPPALAKPG